MRKKIIIRKAYYKDVTDQPHFEIELSYKNSFIKHEDIYFDDLNGIVNGVADLDIKRNYRFELNGGPRFTLLLPGCDGNISVEIKAERTYADGCVYIKCKFENLGESTSELFKSLKKLFNDGETFVLE